MNQGGIKIIFSTKISWSSELDGKRKNGGGRPAGRLGGLGEAIGRKCLVKYFRPPMGFIGQDIPHHRQASCFNACRSMKVVSGQNLGHKRVGFASIKSLNILRTNSLPSAINQASRPHPFHSRGSFDKAGDISVLHWLTLSLRSLSYSVNGSTPGPDWT
jgi:hypothetical protein